jgi:hypothetical protein
MTIKVKALPSVTYLNECFIADYITGVLTWRARPREHFETDKGWKIFTVQNSGKVAGSIDAKGYSTLNLKGFGALKCHKIVYTMFHEEDVPYVDHYNQDRACNGISNLRPTDHQKNTKNTRKYSNNKTGVNGVGYRESTRGTQKRFVSYWKSLCGKDMSKDFSLRKYGGDAFRLACEYRTKMIGLLNSQGAGYTTEHGL